MREAVRDEIAEGFQEKRAEQFAILRRDGAEFFGSLERLVALRVAYFGEDKLGGDG